MAGMVAASMKRAAKVKFNSRVNRASADDQPLAGAHRVRLARPDSNSSGYSIASLVNLLRVFAPASPPN